MSEALNHRPHALSTPPHPCHEDPPYYPIPTNQIAPFSLLETSETPILPFLLILRQYLYHPTCAKSIANQSHLAEVKHLKSLVRNIIDPSRDLGHIDRSLKKSQQPQPQAEPQNDGEERKKPLTVAAVGETPGGSGQPRPGHQHPEGEVCEDCG